jgi:hypothetical protein
MAILLTISNDLSSRLAPEKYSMISQAVKASLRLAALGLDPLALLLLIGKQATARGAAFQLWLKKLSA